MHDSAEERNDDDTHAQAMSLHEASQSVAAGSKEHTHSGSHPAAVDALFAQFVAQLLRPLSWASTAMPKRLQRGSWRPLLAQL